MSAPETSVSPLNNNEDPIFEEQDLTFADIYSNLVANGEIVLTLSVEDVRRVVTGVKNIKARTTRKQEADGIPVEPTKLEFSETESQEFSGCIDLRIIMKKTDTIHVLKMVMPSTEF